MKARARRAVELLRAQGAGSSPGLPPVEGFSNFLWVLLLAPLFRIGLFHPVITAKVLGVALVAASLVIVRQATGSDRAAILAALLQDRGDRAVARDRADRGVGRDRRRCGSARPADRRRRRGRARGGAAETERIARARLAVQ